MLSEQCKSICAKHEDTIKDLSVFNIHHIFEDLSDKSFFKEFFDYLTNSNDPNVTNASEHIRNLFISSSIEHKALSDKKIEEIIKKNYATNHGYMCALHLLFSRYGSAHKFAEDYNYISILNFINGKEKDGLAKIFNDDDVYLFIKVLLKIKEKENREEFLRIMEPKTSLYLKKLGFFGADGKEKKYEPIIKDLKDFKNKSMIFINGVLLSYVSCKALEKEARTIMFLCSKERESSLNIPASVVLFPKMLGFIGGAGLRYCCKNV